MDVRQRVVEFGTGASPGSFCALCRRAPDRGRGDRTPCGAAAPRDAGAGARAAAGAGCPPPDPPRKAPSTGRHCPCLFAGWRESPGPAAFSDLRHPCACLCLPEPATSGLAAGLGRHRSNALRRSEPAATSTSRLPRSHRLGRPHSSAGRRAEVRPVVGKLSILWAPCHDSPRLAPLLIQHWRSYGCDSSRPIDTDGVTRPRADQRAGHRDLRPRQDSRPGRPAKGHSPSHRRTAHGRVLWELAAGAPQRWIRRRDRGRAVQGIGARRQADRRCLAARGTHARSASAPRRSTGPGPGVPKPTAMKRIAWNLVTEHCFKICITTIGAPPKCYLCCTTIWSKTRTSRWCLPY